MYVVALKWDFKMLLQIISQSSCFKTIIIFYFQPPLRINARWTNEELLLAVQGVRKYGKDFKAIAEVIGNKTEAHIRSFFVNYRRRYNLDEVLAEYENEYGIIKPSKDDLEEEEVSQAYRCWLFIIINDHHTCMSLFDHCFVTIRFYIIIIPLNSIVELHSNIQTLYSPNLAQSLSNPS